MNQTPSDSNNRYFQNLGQVADVRNSRPYNEPYLNNQTYFRNEHQVQNQRLPPQHNQYSPNKFPSNEISRSVIVSDQEKINALTGTVSRNKTSANLNINWALYFFIMFFSISVMALGGSLFVTHMTKMIKQKEDFGVIKTIIFNLSQPPIIEIKLLTLTQSELEAEQVSSNVGAHHTKHIFHKTAEQDIANNLATVQQVEARTSDELAQLLNTNSKQFRCPQGFEMQKIGYWPGVEGGCICSDGIVHPSIHCMFKKEEECRHVQEEVPKDLWHWGNQRFCVKRAKNFKWVGTQACPQNMKKCQIGLCIMLQEPCPITSIEMTNEQPHRILLDQAAETRPLKKIVTASDNSKQILVSLGVIGGAITNAQCFNSNLGPQFESKKTYPLSNLQTIGCPSRMMIQYSKTLDTQLEMDVYKQNYLGAKLLRIPFYDKFTDKRTDHLNLQYITRVQVADKIQCDKFDQQALVEVKLQSDDLHILTKFVSMCLLIIASLIVITAVILFIMRDQAFGSLFISGVQQTKIYFYFALICAIILILFGLFYFHHVEMKNGLKQYHQEFNNYLINNCFGDVIVKNTLKNIDQFSQNVYVGVEYQAKLGLALGIFFILVSMILLILQQKTYDQKLFTDPWK